jgi:hypothetical protein
MSILSWLLTPIRVYQSTVKELRSIRCDNIAKLAVLNADIVSGKISGPQLDAVTECLEAQSVNIKTKNLNGGGK